MVDSHRGLFSKLPSAVACSRFSRTSVLNADWFLKFPLSSTLAYCCVEVAVVDCGATEGPDEER